MPAVAGADERIEDANYTDAVNTHGSNKMQHYNTDKSSKNNKGFGAMMASSSNAFDENY